MTLLSMLDRFEQAAVTYETSTDKADRDELHAARRAIMEAFSEGRTQQAPVSREFWLHYDHQGTGHWCVDSEPPRVIRTGAEVIHVREVGARPALRAAIHPSLEQE